MESTGARRREGAAPQSFLPTNEEGDDESVSMCDGGGTMIFSEEGGAAGTDSEGHVTGAINRQQAMNALKMEEWRKFRKKKCKVIRPNDKLVIGSRVIHNRKILDRTKRSKTTDTNLPLKGSGRSKRCTTHPPQRQRESGYV